MGAVNLEDAFFDAEQWLAVEGSDLHAAPAGDLFSIVNELRTAYANGSYWIINKQGSLKGN